MKLNEILKAYKNVIDVTVIIDVNLNPALYNVIITLDCNYKESSSIININLAFERYGYKILNVRMNDNILNYSLQEL